ncbi:MAG: CheR family methyltransferase [Planctomycetota bacterium]
MPMRPEIILTPAAYQFLSQLVYQRSRIRLGPDKQSLVASRLGQRLQALDLDHFDAYCDLLQSPGAEDEIGELIDLISTNHTHFFREPAHFEILERSVLPTLATRAEALARTVRVWSAASSSGEEAYTLAIVLAEHARRRPGFTWRIDASDISRRMLDRCVSGIYPAAKVNVPSTEILHRYFQRGFGEREGFYRVKAELRRQVAVDHINLFQPVYPLPRGFDVIFCRNVMIYFDAPSRELLVNRLTEQLIPGGHLFIGHSESLIGLRHPLESVWPSVYRRPLGATR